MDAVTMTNEQRAQCRTLLTNWQTRTHVIVSGCRKEGE